jgi:hypothetical protein
MPHGLFLPTEAQSLESWLIDGRRYTNSSISTTRVPPINYNLSETPGKAELTAVAASLMRHILFAHRIPLHNFPDIMQCFAVLLLGRPLGLDEFSTGSTLGRHITKVDTIDWYFQMVEFSKYITALSTNGFPRLKMHERSLTCPIKRSLTCPIIYLILVDSSRAPPLPTSRHSPIDRRP